MNRLHIPPSRRIDAIWALTLVLTLVSALLAAHDYRSGPLATSTAETLAVLALAAAKVSCIIWNFMEVRDAPRWLRYSTIGWVGGLWLTIVAIYLY